VRRRVFSVLSVVSLALFVLVAVLWTGSSYWSNELYFHRAVFQDGIAREDTAWLGFAGGRVVAASRRHKFAASSEAEAEGMILSSSEDLNHSRLETMRMPPTGWDFVGYGSVGWRFGFAVGDQSHSFPDGSVRHQRELLFPVWLLLVVLAICPLFFAAKWLRKSRPPGTCAKCGYDLRATPDRCPECGTGTKRMTCA
jgi:hypothetical protein